jgi:hypothetical protein
MTPRGTAGSDAPGDSLATGHRYVSPFHHRALDTTLRKKQSHRQREKHRTYADKFQDYAASLINRLNSCYLTQLYRATAFVTTAGAGFENFAASTLTLACTSFNCIVDCPPVQVTTQ